MIRLLFHRAGLAFGAALLLICLDASAEPAVGMTGGSAAVPPAANVLPASNTAGNAGTPPSGVPVNLDVAPPPGKTPPPMPPSAPPPPATTPAASLDIPPETPALHPVPAQATDNPKPEEKPKPKNEYPQIGARWAPFPVPKPKFNLDTPSFGGDARISVRRPLPPGTLPRPLDREAREALAHMEPSHKQFGAPMPSNRSPCQASLGAAPGLPAPTEAEQQLSNNLRRKSGVFQQAAGQYIEVSGVVRGEDCLPVPGAEVTLWQRDAAGLAVADYRGALERPDLHPDYDKYFSYSGRTFTDNAGRFSFISVLPGPGKKDEPPYVNVAIKALHYETLVTRIYLLPNKEPEGSIAFIPPSNPFVNTDIPPLYQLKGVLSSSEIIAPEPGRTGIRFYSEIALAGRDPNRNY